MISRLVIIGRIAKHALSREYLSIRFLLWITVILTVTFSIQLLVSLMRILDLLLFPAYRKTEVKAPIYIIANPRSGTTFLHRLMCEDPQFTHLKLYQSIFSSVLWYRVFSLIGWVDGKIGHPVRKLIVNPLNRLAFGGWDGIHKAGFDQPEEDEATWVYMWATPGIIVLLPFLRYLDDVMFPDRLPPETRRQMNDVLYRSVQRHLYVEGRDKTYLAKNAVAAERMQRYIETMPDLRIVHLYRHPYESVASALSMFCKVWKTHSPRSYGDTPDTRYVAEMWCNHYRILTELKDQLPPEQYIEFAYTDFVADPKQTVEQIYDRFGLDMNEDFGAFLASENERARNYESVHSYDLSEFGISEEWIYEQLSDVFERYGFER